jgi:hypothetical protein
MAGAKKPRELPPFELRAVFAARFPHPHRDGPLDEMTLRYIITVTGDDDEALRDSGYYYAKAKLENLGLRPLGIELEDCEYFALVGDVLARERIPAEALELYGEAMKPRRCSIETRIS